MPFAPKAFNAVKGYVKYGPKIGINSELIKGLKEAKGFKNKTIEFSKANLRIKFYQMAEEMGCKVKPKLVFSEEIPQTLGGCFDPTTGEMIINTKYLNPIFRAQLKNEARKQGAKLNISDLSPEGFLRHELEHFKQFSDIARSEELGVGSLRKILVEYHSNRSNLLNTDLEQLKTQAKTLKEASIVKSEEIQIKAMLSELENTIKYIERETNITNKMLKNPDTIFNKTFYENICDSTTKFAKGSQEAIQAQKYTTGLADKLNTTTKIQQLQAELANGKISMNKYNEKFLEIYENNVLEIPAYKVQRDYIKQVLAGRPGIKAATAQAHSAIDANA